MSPELKVADPSMLGIGIPHRHALPRTTRIKCADLEPRSPPASGFVLRHISALSEDAAWPIDGDPALGWTGSASSEKTMTAETPIPARQHDPRNKGRMIGQKRPLKHEGRGHGGRVSATSLRSWQAGHRLSS